MHTLRLRGMGWIISDSPKHTDLKPHGLPPRDSVGRSPEQRSHTSAMHPASGDIGRCPRATQTRGDMIHKDRRSL